MTEIDKQIADLVKKGAAGDYISAGEACKLILQEGYLGVVGWPQPSSSKPAQKKTYAPRPNDKGFKMNAKKAGSCVVCSGPIAVGDSIYFKSGDGAKHEACVSNDAVA